MTQFVILFIFAMLVEAIVELILGDVTCPNWVKKVVSMILGVTVCIVWKVGLIGLLGVTGGVPIIDYIATGIIISRGSNYLSDWLTRVKAGITTTTTTVPPTTPATTTTTTTETTPTEPPAV